MSNSHPILTAGVASNQSIYEVTASPRHRVGTRAQTSDGRTFYYARTQDAAALAPGKLIMSEVVVANNANINPSAAAAVGATSVALTLGGSSTYDETSDFEGGYLVVNDATGEGRVYSINYNSTVSAGTALTVYLDDAIETALTTSSEVTLVKNPWADVVIAAAGHVHFAAGVPLVTVGSAASVPQFFWAQTWGVCGVWDDAATAIGAVLQSGTTAGQVEVGDGAAQPVGVQLYTGVDGEYYPKFLTIAP